jgi:hypothetical protein
MSEPQLMAIFDDIIDDGFEIDRQLARGWIFKIFSSIFNFLVF